MSIMPHLVADAPYATGKGCDLRGLQKERPAIRRKPPVYGCKPNSPRPGFSPTNRSWSGSWALSKSECHSQNPFDLHLGHKVQIVDRHVGVFAYEFIRRRGVALLIEFHPHIPQGGCHPPFVE